jgi:glutamate N-acetyltransferase/amino-acid N-acetyltransferase
MFYRQLSRSLTTNLNKYSIMKFTTKVEAKNLPKGFLATGVSANIKKTTVNDVSLIVSEVPTVAAAAVFTQNKFCAAPVLVCKEILKAHEHKGIRAIVVNSGRANAVTGEVGLKNAKTMASIADSELNITSSTDVPSSLVMSTGVIGHHLPMDKIEKGIKAAVKLLKNTPESWLACAEGFMTTDTQPKLVAQTFRLPSGGEYRLAGISKGAGMIHPNMATLLSAVATDVNVSPDCLNKALKYATERSFNAISVDGDTSTNDTCAVLANGQANNTSISEEGSADFKQFQSDLTDVMIQLAQKIVKDAEGATKFVQVKVKNAVNFSEAKTIASSIVTSSLVKTALYGNDANWGRIVCAIGYCGVDSVDPSKVSLTIFPQDNSTPLELLKNGEPIEMDEERALAVMQQGEINIEVDLGLGSEEATMWTCDMSHEYVTINGSYRS